MEPDRIEKNETRMGGPLPSMIFAFFLVLFVLSIGLLGWLLQPFFPILVLGFVVTGVFNPVYGALATKLRPAYSSAVTCVLIFLVLFVPIVTFVSILSTEAYGLYVTSRASALDQQILDILNQSRIIEKATDLLGRYGVSFTAQDLNTALTELGRVVGGFLFNQAQAVATNVLSFVVNFFFMLIVVYFFLIDGKKFFDFVIDLSPLPTDQDEKIIKKFSDMATAILLGNGFCGLLQGFLGGVAFAVFNLGSPLLWGVIMAILAFLPIVGVGAVMIPAAVLLLLKGKVGAGIFFIVFYLVLSFSVEYILKPRLVGKRVEMHPLLVFLAIMGGLKIFGILGVIYGPLVVTLFLTLTDIYHANYQRFVESSRS